MASSITLDYNNMTAARLGGRGIRVEHLERAADAFGSHHRAVERRRESGELEFFQLPDRVDDIERILEFAASVEGEFDDVVVLGIGGSALGTIALREALAPAFWNQLDESERGGRPRLHVLDNIDPTTFGPLLDRLDPGRTLFNVVSKSGATAETMAQYMIVRGRLQDSLGPDDARRRLVFTTDPESGVLRRIAQEEGIVAFPIPTGVGGRFSVLSAVGLLPAALIGIDIRRLLDGAAVMAERCATAELSDNPAGLFAALQFAAHREAGASMHVVMAYSDRLLPVADWFRQLWAESLGKRYDRSGREVFRGPTPIKALGATDQHSQVQLYIEGPFDKTVTFLSVRDPHRDVEIPRLYPDVDALAYLGGHTLGTLLRAERLATAGALADQGRMNMGLELAELSEQSLGELFMMLQIATVYAGEFYDVDPLDQPGVELGKRLTYALMGRPGFDSPPAERPDASLRWP